MARQLIPIAAAIAAVLALSACETAEPETITWNTPRQTETQAAAPAGPTEPQCREFQTTVTIGGKPEKAYGRACRQPDGTWKQVGSLDTSPPQAATPPALQSYPYGWYGYEYPYGPRYGPGYSVGIGAGTGGGFIGYGVGF